MSELNNLHANADFKSDRLNHKVALFVGCTLNEAFAVLGISFAISLAILTLPIYALFGMFIIGLAMALVGMGLLFPVLLVRLSRLKQGKPAGYYQQYLVLKLVKLGVIKSPYILRCGTWSSMRCSS